MQSLQPLLAIQPLESLRGRRNKKWVCLRNQFGTHFSSHQSLFLSSNLVPRNGYFSKGVKPRSALSLALDQTPVGSEKYESKSVRFDAVGGDGNKEVESETEKHESKKVDTRALAWRLHDARNADDVDTVLKDVHILPLPVYSSMIRGFGVDNRLNVAFAVVEWLKRKRKDHIGPNLFIYNSLLSAVKHTGQFGRVEQVLEDMTAQEVAPNIVTYNTLMSIYIEQGRFSEALNVLEVIKRRGLSPSPVTYSGTLLAYKKMNDPSGAVDYFVKLREAYEKGEIGKDDGTDWKFEFVKFEKFVIQTCCLMIRRSIVNEDSTANVFKLLSYMDKAGMKPARAEYERLVWACTRDIHYEVARELYRRIREVDGEISLSVCNHVIWVMGKAKKWWAALEIYEELLDKGPKPNNLSYELIISHFNFLLSAARRKGIWRWGVRLLNKMQDKGLRPGTREWNAVLVACSKASETSAAVQIFKRMVEQGEKPTVLSYGALLSALEKGKLYDEALRVWEHMCKVGVKPNVYAYTILASIYAGQGRPEMVDSVLHEMISSGVEPNIVTYNAIITGCARNRMGSAALEWFHRMNIRDIKPNEITYEMLVEALTNDGKPRLGFEMYLTACTRGLNLSSRSYDAVVESCQAEGTGLDINVLGPRPPEKKKKLKIRKNLTEFQNLADLPRKGKPFDVTEIYDSQIQ